MSIYKSAAQIAGSWLVSPSAAAPGGQVLPGVLLERATLVGYAREPSGGYAVGSKSFTLTLKITQNYAISFTAGNKTLAEVVAVINAATAAGTGGGAPVARDVAYNDNGFLRLEDSTTGATPGAISVHHIADFDVLSELGLFAGVTMFKGELQPTSSWDPDRQVALTDQLLLVDGEDLSAHAINKALYQIASNVDFHEGLLNKKRVARPAEIDAFTYNSGDYGAPDVGYKFSGGKTVLVDPATALDKLFTVLDSNFIPLTVENETVASTPTGSVSWWAEQRRMTVAGTGFLATDPKNDVYVRITTVIPDQGQGEDQLQNELLKVSRYINSAAVEVLPIVPSSGAAPEDPSDWNIGVATVERVEIFTSPVVVSAIKDSNNGTDVRLGPVARSGFGTPRVPTRTERNNRIVIDDPAVDFTVDTVEGDVVIWTGHASSPPLPYDNNVVYRVSAVIDAKTIEVSDSFPNTWGPTALISDLSTPGTIVVQTDGLFWKDPFIEFSPQVPPDGTDITIAYNKLSNIGEATNDPLFLGAGAFGAKYAGVADTKVQEAVLAIIGPSATDLTSYLHEDRRNSLEDIYYRTNAEHHLHDDDPDTRVGRHSDIRPDHIDMWSEIPGVTLRVRGDVGETSEEKIEVVDASDVVHFHVSADGTVSVYENASGDTRVVVSAGNVTTGQAAVKIAGEAATGPASSLQMIAAAAAADPLSFVWDVDANDGSLNLSVTNDGGGGTVPNLLRIDAGTGTVYVDNNFVASVISAKEAQLLQLSAGAPSGGVGAGLGAVLRGSPGLGGSDLNGGFVHILGGDSTGAGYSYVALRAATAGTSGTGTRATENYLVVDGSTGRVELFKTLDLNGNSIVSAGGVGLLNNLDMNNNDIVNVVGITASGVVGVDSLQASASVAVSVSNTSSDPRVSVTQTGTGDAVMSLTAGGNSYQWGIDNSASDKFVLQPGGSGLDAADTGLVMNPNGSITYSGPSGGVFEVVQVVISPLPLFRIRGAAANHLDHSAFQMEPSSITGVAGGTRPASCTPGEFYSYLNGSSVAELYFCKTANSWTLVA